MLLALLLACAEADPAPALRFLAPTDDTEVDASSPVAISLLVENFTVGDAGAKHNENDESGIIELTIAPTTGETPSVSRLTTTTTTVDLVEGAHVLTARLLHADGHALEPEVSDSIQVMARDADTAAR
jgi:hypothetical protein